MIEYEQHNDNKRAYIRDIILGINDGMISTFLLTVGIYASGLSMKAILLTILSSSLGGMISMGLGEYLATKSQIEVTNAELEIEQKHIDEHIDIELNQVRNFLKEDILINNESLITEFINSMRTNKIGLLNFMKRFEFGITDDDIRNPVIAMLVSGLLYFIGSLPTIISFSLVKRANISFYIAIGLNTISLFLVGALKTTITKTSIIYSGGENLVYASIGGLISYSSGYIFSSYLIKN